MQDLKEFRLDDREKFRNLGMWSVCKKKVRTLAIRIEGPFRVEVPSGDIVTCSDGYLALDSQGCPYPISTQDFEQMYEVEAQINGKCLFSD